MHSTAQAQLGQLGCAYAQPSEAWPAGIRSPVQVGNPQGRRAAGPVLCQAVPGAGNGPRSRPEVPTHEDTFEGRLESGPKQVDLRPALNTR